MTTIYKYALSPDAENLILPRRATILSVGVQGNEAFAWVMIDLDEKTNELWPMAIYGTGHPVTARWVGSKTFRGTLHFSDGLVFHVFIRHPGVIGETDA